MVRSPVSTPVRGTDAVVVACKSPNGLILRYFVEVETMEGTPAGPRKTKIWRETPSKRFTVRGPAKVANPHVPGAHLIQFFETYGGYAITPGCPRDLWDQWAHFNEDLVSERIVQAFDSVEEAEVWCRQQRDVRSGMEPIDPQRPELTTGTGMRNALGGVSVIQPGNPT